MCRDDDHGGRRCPHDTSEARQARRVRARARAEYSSELSLKANVDVVASSAAISPVVSVERVRELQAEIREFEAAHTPLPYHLDESGERIYEVAGEEFTDQGDAWRRRDEVMEAKTVEAGAMVAALAAERSGVAQDAMQAYYQAESARLKAVLEANPDDPLTPEEEVRLAELRVEVVNAELEYEAYATAHRDDYPQAWLDDFAGRTALYLNDHPDDMVARAKLDEYMALLDRTQQLRAQCRELQDKKRATVADARKRYASLNSEYGRTDPVLAEMMLKRAEAYREILGEIRPMGGVELKVGADSHKKSVKVLQSALRYYPADWIEASNKATEFRPLRVKKTTARAHYTNGAYQKKSSRMPSVRSYIEDANWQPRENYLHDHGAIVVQPDEYGRAIHTLANGYVYEASCAPGEVMVVKPDLEIWKDGGRQRMVAPPGRGWQKVITNDIPYGKTEPEEYVNWVRQKTRVYESSKTVTAELTISPDGSGFQGEDGFRVAVHEFAHRVEATSPQRISRIESAFLERRRKQSLTEGEEDKAELTKIFEGSKREVGYEDEFVNRYMGKVYPGSPYKELLSTGMEAMFAGSYGGLMGVAGTRRDDDMQHLILGLLATA
jgi:hypothetical protein